MSFDFPSEVIKEGMVNIVVPKLDAYIGQGFEHAPSKAPVFYNPIMELNRDITVLALQVYQKMVGREISVCEPLTGSGIRGVRFALEVKDIKEVFVNDISPEAAKLANFNVEKNGLIGRVKVMNEDANRFLGGYTAPFKRNDVIDIDPFGSPVYYLDSAIRAIRDGGLLALTATDMAPLCGIHPRACIRKYGGKPLRTEYCHELAVRLLLGCLAMIAAKHGFGIRVKFSHSTDHYIRVYAVTQHGAKKADESLQRMGYILHCFACLHREVLEGLFSFHEHKCKECGLKINVAGPLWLGKLLEEDFCLSMQREMEGRRFRRRKKVLRLLSLVRGEANSPSTYYVVDKICDKMNLPVPPLSQVMNKLRLKGCQATPTHFSSRGVKTDGPAGLMKEIIKQLNDFKGK